VRVRERLGPALGRELFLYSITLDAATDTPERLREYAERYGPQPGWTLLTGDPGEITRLRHRLGAFDPDPVVDADITQHAAVLIFGNEPRGRWCAVPGLMDPEAIVRVLGRAMNL